MDQKEGFFSSKHERLLGMASWSRVLAWIVLTAFVLDAISFFYQNQIAYGNALQNFQNFTEIFRSDPGFAIKMILDSLSIILKGLVYYLVLRGISLGLNMIVETDINYRENRKREARRGQKSA